MTASFSSLLIMHRTHYLPTAFGPHHVTMPSGTTPRASHSATPLSRTIFAAWSPEPEWPPWFLALCWSAPKSVGSHYIRRQPGALCAPRLRSNRPALCTTPNVVHRSGRLASAAGGQTAAFVHNPDVVHHSGRLDRRAAFGKQSLRAAAWARPQVSGLSPFLVGPHPAAGHRKPTLQTCSSASSPDVG